MRPSRDETMMELARVIAKRSTCRRRGVGAVATDAYGRVLAIGHNGPARGEAHCTTTPCDGVGMASGTGLDVCRAIHAEQNVLMFCSDIMAINTIYVTASPCPHCIKMLMNTGCRRIIYDEVYSEVALDWWRDRGRVAEPLYEESDLGEEET
jgi:dCMP deaminase